MHVWQIVMSMQETAFQKQLMLMEPRGQGRTGMAQAMHLCDYELEKLVYLVLGFMYWSLGQFDELPIDLDLPRKDQLLSSSA